MSSAVAAGEQAVLAAKRDWMDRAFDRIGVEFDTAIVQEEALAQAFRFRSSGKILVTPNGSA